jgi:hypothetical protein
MIIWLGNESAREGYYAPEDKKQTLVMYRPLKGRRITTVHIPPDRTALQAAADIISAQGVYGHHFEPGSKPVWVEGDDPLLVASLRNHWGVGGRPEGWVEDAGQ